MNTNTAHLLPTLILPPPRGSGVPPGRPPVGEAARSAQSASVLESARGARAPFFFGTISCITAMHPRILTLRYNEGLQGFPEDTLREAAAPPLSVPGGPPSPSGGGAGGEGAMP